jgi:hypothetical protein
MTRSLSPLESRAPTELLLEFHIVETMFLLVVFEHVGDLAKPLIFEQRPEGPIFDIGFNVFPAFLVLRVQQL